MPEILKPIPAAVPEYDDGGGDAPARGEVEIYDTTLRDGAQSEEISYSVDDKLKILRALDRLGVRFVEGGWPGANPKDEEFFRRAPAELRLERSQLVAFGSTRRAGVKADDDEVLRNLVKAGTPVVCIVAKSWDYHVTEALRTQIRTPLMLTETSDKFDILAQIETVRSTIAQFSRQSLSAGDNSDNPLLIYFPDYRFAKVK